MVRDSTNSTALRYVIGWFSSVTRILEGSRGDDGAVVCHENLGLLPSSDILDQIFRSDFLDVKGE